MIETLEATPEDEAFLFQLYVATRIEELQAWGWGEKERHDFLCMQWKAQSLSYASGYPTAVRRIIRYQQIPVGQIYVSCQEDALVLVDLSLLPEYRNRGIGSTLIKQMQNKAHRFNMYVRLSVIPTNPAAALYKKLGFRQIGSTGLHDEMEWHAIFQAI